MVMTLGATILLCLCQTIAHAQTFSLSHSGKYFMLENTFLKKYEYISLGVTALSEQTGWSIGYKVEPNIPVKRFVINPYIINSFGEREGLNIFITPGLSLTRKVRNFEIGLNSKYFYNFNLQSGVFYYGIILKL